MLPPVSYQPAEMLAPPGRQNPGQSYPQSFSSMLSENSENTMAQTDPPGFQELAAQDGLDEGALAMWSNAPSGFECVVILLSGMYADMITSQMGRLEYIRERI